jgi:Sec-independent protein translocase protein TatA
MKIENLRFEQQVIELILRAIIFSIHLLVKHSKLRKWLFRPVRKLFKRKKKAAKRMKKEEKKAAKRTKKEQKKAAKRMKMEQKKAKKLSQSVWE